MDYLIDPSFLGVNRYFVSSFEDNENQTSYKRYFLVTVEIKDYNFIIDGQNFFDQPVKSSLRIYDSIRKTASGQEYDYTTCLLLDYNYFKKYYEIIAIDLRKQQALDAYPKVIQ